MIDPKDAKTIDKTHTVFRFRLSAELKAAIEKEAVRLRVTPSEYARMILAQALRGEVGINRR